MSPAMRPALGTLLVLLGVAPGPALADEVVPTAAVRTRVIVRERPEASSRDVGSLRPRERAEYLGAAPGWRRVRLADGTTGFVSEAFTEVRALAAGAEKAPATPPAPPPASVWSRLGSSLGFSPQRRSSVDTEVRDPQLADGVYRNLDPDLPIAGFARLAGSSGRDDVVVVLDVSTSANEHAGVDVNGDGRRDDGWKGRDSIYRAQLAAVRNLV